MDTTGIIEIGHFDVLTKIHKGLDLQEALVISHLTGDGYSVFLICGKDNLTVTEYHVYDRLTPGTGSGQLMAGSAEDWTTFKNNGYEPTL